MVKGRTCLKPDPALDYHAFVDMSGGGDDDSVLAIGHRDDHGQLIVNLLMDQGHEPAGPSIRRGRSSDLRGY